MIGEERWPYPAALREKEYIEDLQGVTEYELEEKLDQLALSYDLVPSEFEKMVLFRTILLDKSTAKSK